MLRYPVQWRASQRGTSIVYVAGGGPYEISARSAIFIIVRARAEGNGIFKYEKQALYQYHLEICIFLCRLWKRYSSLLLMLAKILCLIPMQTTIIAAGVTELFLSFVWKLHGVPIIAAFDCGPRFVSLFWRHLMNMIGTKSRLSTAFHPQTDGQVDGWMLSLRWLCRVY